jgi:hypothetical protein
MIITTAEENGFGLSESQIPSLRSLENPYRDLVRNAPPIQETGVLRRMPYCGRASQAE